jgi:hypothetical protein
MSQWINPANDPDFCSIAMLYNHTITVGGPTQEDIDTPTVPMEELEEVILGGKYKTKGGRIVTMVREIDTNAGEYFQGYRFFGSNHLIYKRYGETYELGMNYGDDIVARVI